MLYGQEVLDNAPADMIGGIGQRKLVISRIQQRKLKALFAEVKRTGGTVKYNAVRNGLFHVTYLSLNITGTMDLIRKAALYLK